MKNFYSHKSYFTIFFGSLVSRIADDFLSSDTMTHNVKALAMWRYSVFRPLDLFLIIDN
jgi:hypothetical protein